MSMIQRNVHRIVRNFKRDVLGMHMRAHTDDRRVLEDIIFPYFLGSERYANVLFVGCQWYTRGYNKSFERRKNFWTVEPDQSQKKYGAKQHVTDSLQNLDRYFQNASFDVILCNGIIGFGLDTISDADRAFCVCYDILSVGGVLVLGWNDIARRRPFELHQCRSLQNFKPFCFPPLAASTYPTDTPNRHTYSFYER